MSTQSTAHNPDPVMDDFSEAYDALSALRDAFPGLPVPFVMIHTALPVVLDMQTRTAGGFEQWRTALKIPVAAVELHDYAGAQWLEAPGAFNGVTVRLAGHGIEADTKSPRTAGVVPLGQAFFEAAGRDAAAGAAEAAGSVAP
ncbi:hypothetical protein GCM10010400_57970 [Streptomyces aculeolatus]|uniref:hypothetical protein n=1 Tax=Streptomyces aculeolatus TaxID=270689 RepID=UPI001CEC9AEC|nr:hypothetical protein [Streptomyces aculeolatus]